MLPAREDLRRSYAAAALTWGPTWAAACCRQLRSQQLHEAQTSHGAGAPLRAPLLSAAGLPPASPLGTAAALASDGGAVAAAAAAEAAPSLLLLLLPPPLSEAAAVVAELDWLLAAAATPPGAVLLLPPARRLSTASLW